MKWTLAVLFAIPLWAWQAPGNAVPDNAAPLPRPVVRNVRVVVPPDVLRGDKVRVRVTCGGVLLQFDADAESSGHIGETVIVRNPENNRRFVARVEDKGKVFVKK
jgi:flagella basal body P-ring formation protein FlgA